jgi:hypothetical protein
MAVEGSDHLVISDGSMISVRSLRSGRELWNMTLDSNNDLCTLVPSDNKVTLLYMGSQRLIARYLGLNDRTLSDETTLVSDSQWLMGTNTSCSYTYSLHLISCFDPSTGLIYVKDLNGHTKSFDSFKSDSEFHISSVPIIRGNSNGMVHVGDQVVAMDTTGSTFKPICTSGCAMGHDRDVTVVASPGERGLNLQVFSPDGKTTVDIKDEVDRGGVVNVDVFVLNKMSGGKISWRVTVLREDSSISFISSSGDLVWVREEGLASIVAVEIVDLPSSQSAAETFLTLLESEANPFITAYKRLNFQLELAKDLVQMIAKKGIASVLVPGTSEELLRDNFNTRKLLIALTKYNKVYGLDTQNGGIAWQLYIPGLRPLIDEIYVLRSSVHPPHPSLGAIVGGASSCTTGSVVYEFNLITGELTNQNCLEYHVTLVTLLPSTDHTYMKSLVFLDSEGYTHCYPNRCGYTSLPVFLYSIDSGSGKMGGVRLRGDDLPASPTWSTLLPPHETILRVVPNRHGFTHSMGRVRSDRSVQYKYLNPHLVAVATQSMDPSNRPNLNVYLIDAINGGMVYHVIHRAASHPVNIVLCENWMIYTYYSMKLYRQELVIVELYDPRNETESVWSSLAPPVLPLVTSQSYVMPTAIVALSYTTTQRSITHKSLLFGLSSGHIMAMPRDILDPRRNITSTQEMMDEGLPPYVPLIPFQPRMTINYNQTVSSIRSIYTAPTGLESTSIVFACGLDLYLTRVTPSKQFDMLADDFDYRLIAGVVGILTIGTLVLSYLAARKNLNIFWK